MASHDSKSDLPLIILYSNVIGVPIYFFLIASHIGNSEKEVEWLLTQTGPKSTVTIWGQDILESADVIKLKNMIQKIGAERVYLDVYEDLRNAIIVKA